MDRLQKTILIFYCLVVSVLCTYLPWQVYLTKGNSEKAFAGYAWLWNVPDIMKFNGRLCLVSGIDVNILSFSLLATTVFFTGIFIMLSMLSIRKIKLPTANKKTILLGLVILTICSLIYTAYQNTITQRQVATDRPKPKQEILNDSPGLKDTHGATLRPANMSVRDALQEIRNTKPQQ